MTMSPGPDDANDNGDAAMAAGDPGTDRETIGLMISHALRRAHMVVMDDLNQSIHGDGIRALHYAVMRVVARDPGVRSSQLTSELRIKHTNLVPLLDELVTLNLIERRPIPQDRRARALFLTEAGLVMMVELLPKVAAHERRLTARVGIEGKFTLIGLLNRVADPSFDLKTV